MRIPRIASAAVIFLVLTSCASKGDFEVMQGDMDELKSRYHALDKEFGELKSGTMEEAEKTLKENQQEVKALRKEAADLQASLDSSKVDMQVLAGKVDDAMQTAKKPSQDISLLKEDMDRRLTALEGRTDKLEKNFDDLQNKMAATAAKQVELSPEALYQQGLDMFKGGNYQKA